MYQNSLADNYFSGLLECNKNYCYNLIMEAVHKGIPIKDIYTRVFYPSMVGIGDLWQSNKLTVAQEHFATVITQSIICSLYYKMFSDKISGKRGKIIITCASNEFHELGSRMLSDLLEIEGFNVTFLGANMPIYSVIEMIKTETPGIICISCTMSFNINNVKNLILLIKNEITDYAPILVGGRAFDIDPLLVDYVNADYYSKGFDETIELINSIEM